MTLQMTGEIFPSCGRRSERWDEEFGSGLRKRRYEAKDDRQAADGVMDPLWSCQHYEDGRTEAADAQADSDGPIV